ncbi:MAG: PspC domain-containing protein [Candidatus Neomarinimicrobiota bacterium]
MKKLYRSKKQRILAGVCGGLAEYFEVDPVIVRLIWIVLIVFGGVGVLAYILAWIIIPFTSENSAEPESAAAMPATQAQTNPPVQPQNLRLFWGIVLILVGVLIIAHQFWWPLDIFRMMMRNIFKFFVPALLIVLGIFVILQKNSGSNKE